MASDIAAKKGEEFVAKAEKRLKGFAPFGFGKTAQYEDAFELYIKAAAQFKIASDWDAAGDAFMQAACNAEKSGEGFNAVSNYVEAAKAYKNGNWREAIKAYGIAVAMQMDNNKFNQAAKLYKEMAIIHENQLNPSEALQAYQSAADCWKGESSVAHANQMLLKVAEISAAEHKYKEAVLVFEKVAEQSLESNMMRHSVKDYLFKAALCTMVLASKKDDMDPLLDKIERYKDMAPTCDNSREFNLLEACAQAFTGNDVAKFTEVLFKYDKISKLGNWEADLLLTVKQELKDEGATHGDDVGTDDDITEGADDLGLG